MRKRRTFRTTFEDDVPNAMLGVSNLADVMLVLAVGIMLALVINWHIDVGGGFTEQITPANMEEIDISDESTDLGTPDEIVNNPNLEVRGTVIVDNTTGKMYMVEAGE